MSDFSEKIQRIHHFLEAENYEAMVLGRRDNFAWLTGGKEGGVVLNQMESFVFLVIKKDEHIAVAMRADGRKAVEELLTGMNFRLVELDWKSSGKEKYIEDLLKGKAYVSDIPLSGSVFDLEAIYELEYPMTNVEIDRYRELGKITEMILLKTAMRLRKGMTENELKAEFMKLCAEYRVETDVILLGSDERIESYRHCTPTDRPIKKYVLLSPVIRKYGLHSNTARMFCLGKASENTKRKLDVVNQIQAEIIGISQTGRAFGDIFMLQEELYKKYNYQKDWMMHGHGAPVGYMLSDGGVLKNQKRRMQKNQAYEWYVTITGAKSAELVMNIEGRQEILSVTGKWPVKNYQTRTGEKIKLPEILEL